jgi:hypothetical protein
MSLVSSQAPAVLYRTSPILRHTYSSGLEVKKDRCYFLASAYDETYLLLSALRGSPWSPAVSAFLVFHPKTVERRCEVETCREIEIECQASLNTKHQVNLCRTAELKILGVSASVRARQLEFEVDLVSVRRLLEIQSHCRDSLYLADPFVYGVY